MKFTPLFIIRVNTMALERKKAPTKTEAKPKALQKTTAYVYDLNGRDIFTIAEESTEKAIIAFGLVKAQAIIAHIEDIKEFIASQKK